MSRLLSLIAPDDVNGSVEIAIDGAVRRLELLDFVNFGGEMFAVVADERSNEAEIIRIVNLGKENESYTAETNMFVAQKVFNVFVANDEE